MSNYSPANQLRQDAATTRRKVVSFEDHGMNLSKALRTPPTKSKITKVPIRILAFLRSGASVSLGVLVCLFLFNILRAAVEGACIVPGTSHCQKQDADYYLDALPDFGPALVHIQELGTNATILPMQLEYSKNIVKDVAAIVRFSEIGSRDQIHAHLKDYWQVIEKTSEVIGDFKRSIDRLINIAIMQTDSTIRTLSRLTSNSSPSAVENIWRVLVHAPGGAERELRRAIIEYLTELGAEVERLMRRAVLVEQGLERMEGIEREIGVLISGDNEEGGHESGRFWMRLTAHGDLMKNQNQAQVLGQLDCQRLMVVGLVGAVTQLLREVRWELSEFARRIKEDRFRCMEDLEVMAGEMRRRVEGLKWSRGEARKRVEEIMKDIQKQIYSHGMMR